PAAPARRAGRRGLESCWACCAPSRRARAGSCTRSTRGAEVHGQRSLGFPGRQQLEMVQIDGRERGAPAQLGLVHRANNLPRQGEEPLLPRQELVRGNPCEVTILLLQSSDRLGGDGDPGVRLFLESFLQARTELCAHVGDLVVEVL